MPTNVPWLAPTSLSPSPTLSEVLSAPPHTPSVKPTIAPSTESTMNAITLSFSPTQTPLTLFPTVSLASTQPPLATTLPLHPTSFPIPATYFPTHQPTLLPTTILYDIPIQTESNSPTIKVINSRAPTAQHVALSESSSSSVPSSPITIIIASAGAGGGILVIIIGILIYRWKKRSDSTVSANQSTVTRKIRTFPNPMRDAEVRVSDISLRSRSSFESNHQSLSLRSVLSPVSVKPLNVSKSGEDASNRQTNLFDAATP